MSNRSFFYPITDKTAHFLSQLFYEKKLSVNKVGSLVLACGILAPVPLLFHNYWLRILSPVILLIFVALDYSLSYLEVKKHQRFFLNSIISFPMAVIVFLWYELFLCEVVYNIGGLWVFRYINLFSISCAVSGLLIIYGYLKLNNQPLSIYRFTEQLNDFGKENEKDAPFNYLVITFKFLKEDFLVSILLVLSLFNIYLLYMAVALASIGFLGFTAYSLFLMKVLDGTPDSNDDSD